MNFWDMLRTLTASILIVLFAVPSPIFAQSHIVTPGDLQKEMITASQGRQRDLAKMNEFFSSPAAEKALKDARIDPARVKKGLSQLSNEELAKLAARADKAQKDFAAGALSDRDLKLILVTVAAIILIILLIKLV